MTVQVVAGCDSAKIVHEVASGAAMLEMTPRVRGAGSDAQHGGAGCGDAGKDAWLGGAGCSGAGFCRCRILAAPDQ